MGEFLVGVSVLDVTPDLGIPLGGYCRYRPASSLLSQLQVKCLALKLGKAHALIIAADALAIPDRTSRRVRLRISNELGIPADSILLAASHTHSAPDPLGFASPRGRQTAQQYLLTLEEVILEAAERAWADRFPAQAYFARGRALIGYNRVTWSFKQPLYRTLLRARLIRYTNLVFQVMPRFRVKKAKVIGPVDPNLSIIWFQGEDDRGAAIVNYACHPNVLGPRNQAISGDYPSMTTTMIEDALGKGFVTLFTNGAAGNINPLSRQGYWSNGTINDVEQIGRTLASEALFAMRENSTPLKAKLDTKSTTVVLSDSREIQIQAIHIGDCALVAVPGELFVETGLSLALQTKRRVIVVGYANGYVGYLPPEEAFQLHCRETERTWWNSAERGAAEKISTAAKAMMN